MHAGLRSSCTGARGRYREAAEGLGSFPAVDLGFKVEGLRLGLRV